MCHATRQFSLPSGSRHPHASHSREWRNGHKQRTTPTHGGSRHRRDRGNFCFVDLQWHFPACHFLRVTLWSAGRSTYFVEHFIGQLSYDYPSTGWRPFRESIAPSGQQLVLPVLREKRQRLSALSQRIGYFEASLQTQLCVIKRIMGASRTAWDSLSRPGVDRRPRRR